MSQENTALRNWPRSEPVKDQVEQVRPRAPLVGFRKSQQEVSSESRLESALRAWSYPTALACVYLTWFAYMFLSNDWLLFVEHWAITLTMALGSFVAGATAEGGAAVAFPVFTKALHIPPADARTFGLMIQSVGMTMAAVMIYSQRAKVLPKVITWVLLGGILGQVIGTFYVVLPNPYPRVLFTFVSAAFGIALAIARWGMRLEPVMSLPRWAHRERVLFFTIGVFGGGFAAQTGSGIDMLTFIVLTLAFGINEKISTPTTVIIMGFNSVVGFFLRGAFVQDIGIAFEYWLVSIPIVIIGAPLGAYAAIRCKRDHIIYFLLFLISLEVVTTIWLVPLTTDVTLVTLVAVGAAAGLFALMLRSRVRREQRGKPSEPILATAHQPTDAA